jgi:hypothetical protein
VAAKQRLLAAVTQMGFMHARRVLHERFELVPAFSVPQALASLEESEIDAIVCSIHFDESRMFDFLTRVGEVAPEIPIVCCQILRSPLSLQAIDGLVTTAKSLGCRGFVNYNELHRTHGFDEADRRFCEAVVDLVAPGEQRKSGATGL